MRVKLFAIAIVFLCVAYEAFAQSVDVDLYTGQPIVQVPLWTIRSGDLSHQLGITFAANGVKTGLAASKQFGMGWNFDFSGAIYREVRGLPDEVLQNTTPPYRHGWLHQNTAQTIGGFTPTADNNLSNCSDEESDFEFLNSLGGFSTSGTIKDTEPDIFIVSAPGISCRFVFDHSGQIKTIPGSDYKIVALDNNLSAFTVTNDQGVVYSFESSENGYIRATGTESNVAFRKYEYYAYKSIAVPYKKQWKLTSIESPSGDQIKFEYKPINTHPYPVQGDHIISMPIAYDADLVLSNFVSPNTYTNQTLYSKNQTINFPAIPFRITTKNERIDIEMGDIFFPEGTYLLRHELITSIRITAIKEGNEELSRLFTFNYIPTSGNLLGQLEQGIVLEDNVILRSVSESSLLKTFQPIVFDYYGVSFFIHETLHRLVGSVEVDNSSVDEYGFHNDCYIGSGIYKSHVYPSLQGADRYRIQPITGYTGDYYSTPGDYSKLGYTEMLQAGMLRYIHHSNGSVNRIFYEPNSYYDEISGSSVYAGGVRVSRTELHDGISYSNDIIKTYDYKQYNGQSSGKLIYKPERNFNLHFYKPATGSIEYVENMQSLSQKERWQRLSRLTNQVLNEDSNPGINVAYQKVTVNQPGAGRAVYDFSIPIPYGKTAYEDWNATQTRVARDTPAGSTNFVNGSDLAPLGTYYAYPFAPNPNHEFLQGQLDSVTLYNDAGKKVERTENVYTRISEPVKVYGIRLDKFKSPATYTIVEGGVPVQKSEVDMFVYSRYEVNTGARTRLTNVKRYSYDKDSQLAYVLDEKQFQYGSTAHHHLTHTTQVNSDGVEQHTEMKYPQDYTITSVWANQDVSTKAITRLKEQNILSVPIETVSWRKNGNTETIVAGSVRLFDYNEQKNRIDLVKSFSANPGKAKGSYTFTNVSNTSGSSTFTKDNDAYVRYVEFGNQDKKGNPRTTKQFDKSKSSVHFDTEGITPRVVIANAAADEVIFSDFESKDEFDFQYNATAWGVNPVFDIGRISGKALRLMAGSSYKLSAQTNRSIDKNHVFSCWAKTSAAATITVRVLDGVHSTEAKTITLPNTAGQWQYFKVSIPTSAFNSLITVEAETTSLTLIDDVAFYPASASIAHYLYDGKFNKIAETTNGLSNTFEYDGMGKLAIVRDHQRNILKSLTYGVYEGALEKKIPEIRVEGGFVNEPVTFTAEWFDSPGVTYKWKLEDFNHQGDVDFSDAVIIQGNKNWTTTFTEKFSKYLYLQVTYGEIELIQRIGVQITHRPLIITLCSNRPQSLDVCNPDVFDNTCTSLQSPGLNINTSIVNGIGTLTYEWGYWNYATSQYIPMSGLTGSSITISDFIWKRSYIVTVTDSNGTSASAEIMFETFQSDPNCYNPNQN